MAIRSTGSTVTPSPAGAEAASAVLSLAPDCPQAVSISSANAAAHPFEIVNFPFPHGARPLTFASVPARMFR
jgi:hypothetical protein